MAAKNNSGDELSRKWFRDLLVVALGSIGGASGGTYLFITSADSKAIQTIARPDPYTGEQARQLQQRVADLERRVDRLPPRELTQRIALLEREAELLRERIREHEREEH